MIMSGLAIIFNFLLPVLSHAWTGMIIAPRAASPLRSHDRPTTSAIRSVRFHTLQPTSAIESSRSDDDGSPLPSSRRTFLSQQTAAAIAVITSAVASPNLALAAPTNNENDELIDVYFGCGCFWHVQHEFVEAERKLLGRTDDQITSRAGYAGGNAGAIDGKVCYHNAQNIADYGKLGHAEVVNVRIPISKFQDFAIEYCKLFDKDGYRPDQFGDRGLEYRNLIGIPGGKSSPLASSLVQASIASGDKLDFAIGKGSDDDKPKVSYIMDTTNFPFFVAEQYHQFHDGFKLDEGYPESYNSLARYFVNKGENFGSCPNGMMGIGIGGL
jgi:peptide methionine sulfoxide reductase MsrA